MSQPDSHKGAYPADVVATFQDRVHELLEQHPLASTRGLGFVPHNGAIPRHHLTAVGGFDEEIGFSEGWELAYRLTTNGLAVHVVQALSYHLYHHHDFTDRLHAQRESRIRQRAIDHMARKSADPRVLLLNFWLADLWPDPFLPEETLIRSAVEFENKYSTMAEPLWKEYETVLTNHPYRESPDS